MSRSQERASFSTEVRVQLLEGDVDDVAAVQADFKADLKAIRQIATGILTALVVASIMLAINLAVVS